MERRLATILVGDVVGSTAAMEADEEGAVARINACLAAVGEVVSRHAGRVFNTAGDAVLAEFASPVNALRAAMEARSALVAVDGATPQDMRFGLHLADVIAVGDDLRGDGVNLAARIQASAAPGEIEVSATFYDHVRRVSPCVFEDVGARPLKGLSEPMRILRVRGPMDRHVFLKAPTRGAPTVALRPNSITVTPFRVASSADEDQRFLAEGLTEDLILELSRVRDLFVTSRTASAMLDSLDPVEVGARMGVRHVLSGSVRRVRDAIRLNITLSETARGEILWSDRIERPFDEVMDVLDEITARVAATVSNRIEHSIIAAARLKRPDSMTAYEHYLRGLEHHRMGGVTVDHVHEALRWFRRASEVDPHFGRPLAMQVCSWSYLPDFDIETGLELVSKALALDPTDAEAHRIMGVAQIIGNRDYSASRYHHERALELAPNDAYLLGRAAAFHVFVGEVDRALELLERAAALDPFLPVWVAEERLAAYYVTGRFDELFAAARVLPHQTRRSRLYEAAARVATGEVERAARLVREALAEDPMLSADYVRSQELYEDAEVLETLIGRCRAAGLPDHPRLRAGAA